MSKSKGGSLSAVLHKTQRYGLHQMYYKTCSSPGNSLGTFQKYSYHLLDHKSESLHLEGLCAAAQVFSYFFNNLIAFFLEVHSCALVESFNNLCCNFFNTFTHLSITTPNIQLSKQYRGGGQSPEDVIVSRLNLMLLHASMYNMYIRVFIRCVLVVELGI